MAKRTGAHLQPKDAAQQSGPRPVWGGRWRLLPVYPLLARGGDGAFAPVAVRCQTAAIAHQMDVGQGDQRRQLLQEFQRREPNPRGAIGPGMGERVDAMWPSQLCGEDDANV